MLVSIKLLDDKNWQTLLCNTDVKIYCFQGNGMKVACFVGTTFLVNKNNNDFFQVGGVTFFPKFLQ